MKIGLRVILLGFSTGGPRELLPPVSAGWSTRRPGLVPISLVGPELSDPYRLCPGPAHQASVTGPCRVDWLAPACAVRGRRDDLQYIAARLTSSEQAAESPASGTRPGAFHFNAVCALLQTATSPHQVGELARQYVDYGAGLRAWCSHKTEPTGSSDALRETVCWCCQPEQKPVSPSSRMLCAVAVEGR